MSSRLQAQAPSSEEADGVVIRASGLSKCYHIYDRPQDRLKQSLHSAVSDLRGKRPPSYYREFWALSDVSFDVRAGETVGVIGRNGSGKSTLLQMICGILAPTTGEVRTYGRIAALLELGSGFNGDFTGRDNVFVNGAILGMTREEIAARFDDIAAFADIGEFIDQPVKHYSSGMFVRLAFAVNIMSQPRIMVVDEALAVGDMNFQAKCMTALRRLQEGGATILFVSHDIGSVKTLCSRALYLERGKVVASGTAADVAECYVRAMRQEMNEEHRRGGPGTTAGRPRGTAIAAGAIADDFVESREFAERAAPFRYGSGEARVTYCEVLDQQGQALVSAQFDQEVTIRVHLVAHQSKTLAAAYYILDDRKLHILGAGPRQAGGSFIQASAGDRFIVSFRTRLPLQEGSYSIELQLAEPVIPDVTAAFLDVVPDAIVFRVERREAGRVWAKVLLPNTIDVKACGPAAGPG